MCNANGRGRSSALDTGQGSAFKGSALIPFDKSFKGPIWLQASALVSLRVRPQLNSSSRIQCALLPLLPSPCPYDVIPCQYQGL